MGTWSNVSIESTENTKIAGGYTNKGRVVKAEFVHIGEEVDSIRFDSSSETANVEVRMFFPNHTDITRVIEAGNVEEEVFSDRFVEKVKGTAGNGGTQVEPHVISLPSHGHPI